MKNEKSPIWKNRSKNVCLISKPEVFYLRSLSSSLEFPKFWWQTLVYFGRKHVATEPCYSHHELATFLKYHMPLMKDRGLFKMKKYKRYKNCTKNKLLETNISLSIGLCPEGNYTPYFLIFHSKKLVFPLLNRHP